MEEMLKAVEALIEDAELMDGDYWGYLVSVTKLDALKTALDKARQISYTE